jgi:hypothetical protein
MSKAVKITIHKMMVKSVVVFRSETWAVAEMGMKRLVTAIHGPVAEQGNVENIN